MGAEHISAIPADRLGLDLCLVVAVAGGVVARVSSDLSSVSRRGADQGAGGRHRCAAQLQLLATWRRARSFESGTWLSRGLPAGAARPAYAPAHGPAGLT